MSKLFMWQKTAGSFTQKESARDTRMAKKMKMILPSGKCGMRITITADYRTFGYHYTFAKQILTTDATCPGLWFAMRQYRFIDDGWLGNEVISISDEGVERIIKEALDMQRRFDNVTIEIDTKEY